VSTPQDEIDFPLATINTISQAHREAEPTLPIHIEKLSRLRHARSIETDAARIFQLRYQIESCIKDFQNAYQRAERSIAAQARRAQSLPQTMSYEGNAREYGGTELKIREANISPGRSRPVVVSALYVGVREANLDRMVVFNKITFAATACVEGKIYVPDTIEIVGNKPSGVEVITKTWQELNELAKELHNHWRMVYS
jgi:hypothetical protein